MDIDIAISILLSLALESQKIGQLIQAQRAKGSETLTDAEMDAIVGADDAARIRLQAAIAAKA